MKENQDWITYPAILAISILFLRSLSFDLYMTVDKIQSFNIFHVQVTGTEYMQ